MDPVAAAVVGETDRLTSYTDMPMSKVAVVGVAELGAAAVTVSLWALEGFITPATLRERRSPAAIPWGTFRRTVWPLWPVPTPLSETEPGGPLAAGLIPSVSSYEEVAPGKATSSVAPAPAYDETAMRSPAPMAEDAVKLASV